MTFNYEDYTPKLNNWFSRDITYEGEGYAEFAKPSGWIKGKAKVEFDDWYNCSVQFDIDQDNFYVENFKYKELALFEMLHGVETIRFVDGGIGVPFGGPAKNTCTRLSIRTSNGIFHVLQDLINYYVPGYVPQVRFFVSRCQFSSSGERVPNYWVFPLSNFISGFAPRPPILNSNPVFDNHPLRIYSTPLVSNNLANEEKLSAYSFANNKNNLILFEFEGRPGFIEPLPDFKELKEELMLGKRRSAVTAVMVGEVGKHSTDFGSLKKWLPSSFLDLLSLATGSEVGTPWVEFRDERGQLTHRIHNKLARPFLQGHTAIEEQITGGIGKLLTQAQKSSGFRKKSLGITMRQIIYGGKQDLYFEDRLAHLFRALDTLCKEYECYKPIPSKPLALSPENDDDIEKILKKAAQEIKSIAVKTQNAGKGDEANIIRSKILQRVLGAKNVKNDDKEPAFGEAVFTLLEKYKMPDGVILNTYCKIRGFKTWQSLLSEYRGQVIHKSYFDFDDKADDFIFIAATIYHLHDILLRLCFKILNYDGVYQPSVIDAIATDKKANWVNTSTSIEELGYNRYRKI